MLQAYIFEMRTVLVVVAVVWAVVSLLVLALLAVMQSPD